MTGRRGGSRSYESAGHVRAFGYVERVASGDQPAPKWSSLQSARFMSDVDAERWRLDVELADWYISKVETFEHYKGEKAGEKLRLEDWQCFALMNLFGWVDPATGLRRFREALRVRSTWKREDDPRRARRPRDGLHGGRGGGRGFYAAAVSRDQARICFDAARHMALRASPRVKSGRLSARAFSKVYGVEMQKHIIESSEGAVFKPLSRDAKVPRRPQRLPRNLGRARQSTQRQRSTTRSRPAPRSVASRSS
jgi:hypothetical protein